MQVATFAEVFQYTMFAQAGKRALLQDLGASPFPAPPFPQTTIDDSVADILPVWHFDHDAAKTPAKVTNLTCLCRGMGNGRMTVATAVTLESAGIKTAQGLDIDLPLTPDFVIQKGYLKSSKLGAGAHFLHPLQAEIDRSMSVVFGYEFKDGPSAKPVKITEAAMDSNEFMPQAGVQPSAVTVGKGQRAKVVLAPLRVVVFFSFVTAKERADFEPGGILGAGRVWPHVMIMANRDLAETSSVIHVQRPTSLSMDRGDHSTHADMNLTIESAFFSDNNTFISVAPGGPPSPYWHELFSNYDVGVTSGTIRAVDPLEKGGSISGAVQVLDFFKNYVPSTITRVPGQGAYDNVHVAPTMKSPVASRHPTYQLDRIYMAPFCEHDCLHVHWRWSVTNTVQPVFGWAAKGPDPRIPGEPYKVAGTPMVASNQTVGIENTGPNSFRYHAKAVGLDGISASPPIPPGTFSLFFHHGMAYAISLTSFKIRALDALIDTLAGTKLEPDIELPASLSTPTRYWRLRFDGIDLPDFPGVTDIVKERKLTLNLPQLLKRASP
jgi:hypothetical protein